MWLFPCCPQWAPSGLPYFQAWRQPGGQTANLPFSAPQEPTLSRSPGGIKAPDRRIPKVNKGCPDSKHQAPINKRGLFLRQRAWCLGGKEFFSHTQSHSAQSTRALCKARLQGDGRWEGTYLHQEPPAAIPVYLQVFPIAEAHGGHHGVLDSEVTWNRAGAGFRLRWGEGTVVAGRCIIGR